MINGLHYIGLDEKLLCRRKKKTHRLTTNTKFMNHLGLHRSPKTVALNLHHDSNKKVISIKGVLQREKLQRKKTLQTLLKPTANILANEVFHPSTGNLTPFLFLAASRDDDDEDISSQKVSQHDDVLVDCG